MFPPHAHIHQRPTRISLWTAVLLDAARASLSTGQPHLAIAELTSWRETAAAITAGLGSEPVEWLDPDEAEPAGVVLSHRHATELSNIF